jgi:glutamyl-tRNA reductase
MLILLSLDHRRSSVAEREPFAVAPEERVRLGRLIRRACGGQVAFLITCNRVEVIAWVDSSVAGTALSRIEAIAQRIAPELAGRFLARTAVHTGEVAAHHLLRVAAGLESQVQGEVQVLGQVRAAYGLAAASGSVGAELHRLFQTALRSGKRVHAETELGRHGRSAGSRAAAAVVQRLAGSATEGPSADRRVVVLGAGDTGARAARMLISRGVRVTIVNRTAERAAELAHRLGAGTAPFETRHEVIAGAAAAIVATGAPEPTVTAAELNAARRAAGDLCGPLYILDLAVPRNVELGVGQLAHIRLGSLEELNREPAPSRSGAATLEAAERIVRQELCSFISWLGARQAPSVVAA